MEYTYKLVSFNIYDTDPSEINEQNKRSLGGHKEFLVQMFGINEKGETATIYVEDYTPFFYVKVPDHWKEGEQLRLINQIRSDMGEWYDEAIVSYKLIKKKKLYGFDGGKEHTFILIKFRNEKAFNKAKRLWYTYTLVNGKSESIIDPDGYECGDDPTYLYEGNIPPLLRLFHVKEISPSGWIALPKKNTLVHKEKTTLSDYEYTISYKKIVALNKKETSVPYKICSFDIEASSSHGDFPLAKKNYKKLAEDMATVWMERDQYECTDDDMIYNIILGAFGVDGYDIDGINIVYTKNKIDEDDLYQLIEKWIQLKPALNKDESQIHDQEIESEEEEDNEIEEGAKDETIEEVGYKKKKIAPKNYKKKEANMIDMLNDKSVTRDTLILELTKGLDKLFPKLKGDEVTFIGSTFLKYGEDKPYLNHCIAKGSCDKVDNSVIESYSTEKKVLLAWTDLMERENPDIVIGYNIMGFDWLFMYNRGEELGITKRFLKLSRNKKEICLSKKWNWNKNAYVEGMEVNSIFIASGQHDIKYIKMPGRIQIDLYNYFRRDYNLIKYKLDYVASYFIGDKVKKTEYTDKDYTKIYSKNLTGLENGNYVTFEEEAHSTDSYKDGKKFQVGEINYEEGSYMIYSKEEFDMNKKVKWGLAKDDVTPQDIFRMTNEGPAERAIIAKYCIQDCNLVHHLMRKIDVITSYTEMAGLCSVPMEFLVLRGQGIKLTSYISKKCREKNTLMPTISKELGDSSYEGAIVLPPKCDLYLDEPVACVDYSSLYPSSMISENISHDSKVWTKEYNLEDELLIEKGERDENGVYIYDNLEDYEYVDITYDTYKWQHKNNNPKAAMEKVKVGYKTCRWAQFPEGKKGIMPSILEELLAERKRVRKLGKVEKDPFMANILDKRQLSIKVTANSLYGQTGARTSTFYEVDCAASTTATGRKLLTYAQRVIEEGYKDKEIVMNNGEKVKVDAEYVYGDSVTGDEPLVLRNKEGLIQIKTIASLSDEWEAYENFKPFDTVQSNRRNKEKAFVNYEVFANNKWNPIKKVIRHKTNKKIYRVNTHLGSVDVTEDHSLLSNSREKIKPTECVVGETELFHCFPQEFNEFDAYVPQQNEEKENINKEELFKCSTCSCDYPADNYYFANKDKTKRTKQCKICVKKRQCTKAGREFKEEIVARENIFREEYLLTEDEAKVWGMFMGDGSCGKYNCKSGLKYSWGLNNNNLERLNKYKDILEKVEPIEFKILDTLESSGVYKLVPYGSIKYMVDKYRPLMYYNDAKIVPDIILNAKLEIKKAFFEGYYDADGAKTGYNGFDKILCFETKNKISAQCLYYLASSIGYKLYLNINEAKVKDGRDYYRIRSCTNYRKNPNQLKRMIYLRDSKDEYVYDLETEHGTFCAGVGEIELKNTDSVFFKFNPQDGQGNPIKGQKALELTIELAQEAGELATKFLKKPHDLEYEKTFLPFCLLSKKRYVGMLYELNPEVGYRKSMGIVLKRRDNAPIVKDVYGGIIDILMKDRDVEKAVRFLRNCLKDITEEKYPVEKLIITKSLRGYYKNPNSIAHNVLANRIGKRDAGNKPAVGDRIPYIYIKNPDKKALQGERIETPEFIRDNDDVEINYSFYITNQIMKPVQQVFALVLEKLVDFKKKKGATLHRWHKELADLREKYPEQETYYKKVEALRNKEVKALLFSEFI